MSECRPPDGTPDGAVCWLWDERLKQWHGVTWDGGLWCFPNGPTSPGWAFDDGFRFHSLATPPEDAK